MCLSKLILIQIMEASVSEIPEENNHDCPDQHNQYINQMKLQLCTSGQIWFHFSFHVVIHWPDLSDLKVEANSAFSVADSTTSTPVFPDRNKWGQTFFFHDTVQTQCPFSVSSTSSRQFTTLQEVLHVQDLHLKSYVWFLWKPFLVWIFRWLLCEEQTCYKVRCQASRSDCQGILHSSLRDIQRSSTEDSSHTSTETKSQTADHIMHTHQPETMWTFML